jgi:hypothetical protein
MIVSSSLSVDARRQVSESHSLHLRVINVVHWHLSTSVLIELIGDGVALQVVVGLLEDLTLVHGSLE